MYNIIPVPSLPLTFVPMLYFCYYAENKLTKLATSHINKENTCKYKG